MWIAFFASPLAFAGFHTAASFDANYCFTSLSAASGSSSTSTNLNHRTLTSSTGYEIDYNVALFDFRTVATLSFSQFLTSNLGQTPLTRVALGAAYHFIRMNGERVILDNQVESKAWGISPAVELNFGFTSFSPSDTGAGGLGQFSASLLDMKPGVLVEIPFNPNFLILLRGSYLSSLSLFGSGGYTINYSGYIFSIGVKLTTL